MDMASFVRSECATDAEDRQYAAWITQVNGLVGHNVNEDGQAFDLYLDGCDAEDAAAEIVANPY
ncbi:hypothetical protein ACB288_04865 [Aeromonas taiwanensis]